MTVEDWPGDPKAHWPELREALLAGRYPPPPVKRVEIPTPGGGGRKRGIPTVLDRCIQHARLPVLQPAWDGTFSDGRSGFRPGRSAHHAIAQAQQHRKAGDRWVVDLDREKFFDRVNQDKLMSRGKERVTARRVLPRIDRYLKAGALTGDGFEATPEGTPQGGPLSPRLANLLLDGLEQEVEKRGHRCVRDAADCNLYVRSARAGARALASVTRSLKRQWTLVVKAAKSAVDRPWRRTCLGCSCTGRQPTRRQVSAKALKAFKQELRRLTPRTRGVSWPQVAQEVRR
jgi:RNA-directed DNA polymerase